MNDVLSSKTLRALLASEDMIQPVVTDAARAELNAAVLDALADIGLPKRVADWFAAVDQIDLRLYPHMYSYSLRGAALSNDRGVVIGKGDFGQEVIDPKSQCVIYVDNDVSIRPQLINTSLGKFLYFVGRFRRSDRLRFSDIQEMEADLHMIDGGVFSDSSAIWSVMVEEAKAGLY